MYLGKLINNLIKQREITTKIHINQEKEISKKT